jgi:hypothetical protein
MPLSVEQPRAPEFYIRSPGRQHGCRRIPTAAVLLDPVGLRRRGAEPGHVKSAREVSRHAAGEVTASLAAQGGPVHLHGIGAGISAERDPAAGQEYAAADHRGAFDAVDGDREIRQRGPAVSARTRAIDCRRRTHRRTDREDWRSSRPSRSQRVHSAPGRGCLPGRDLLYASPAVPTEHAPGRHT